MSKLLSLHKVAAIGREVRERVRGEVIKCGLLGGGGGSQVVRQPDLSRLSQLCASRSGLTLEYFQSMFQNFIRSTQWVGFFNIGLGRVLDKIPGSGSGWGRVGASKIMIGYFRVFFYFRVFPDMSGISGFTHIY